jgi:hypothetical protein
MEYQQIKDELRPNVKLVEVRWSNLEPRRQLETPTLPSVAMTRAVPPRRFLSACIVHLSKPPPLLRFKFIRMLLVFRHIEKLRSPFDYELGIFAR